MSLITGRLVLPIAVVAVCVSFGLGPAATPGMAQVTMPPTPVSPIDGATVQSTEAITYRFDPHDPHPLSGSYGMYFAKTPTLGADGILADQLPSPTYTLGGWPVTHGTDGLLETDGPNAPGVYYWQPALVLDACAGLRPCPGPVAKLTVTGRQPSLARFGRTLYRIPLSARLFGFMVTCRNPPCTMVSSGKAYVSGRHVAALDPRGPLTIATPPEQYAAWFRKDAFPIERLNNMLKRHSAVRIHITATVTDAAGLMTSRHRTLTIRAKAKPKPPPKLHKKTERERVEDAVSNALQARATYYYLSGPGCVLTGPHEYDCLARPLNTTGGLSDKHLTARVINGKVYVGRLTD